MKYLKRMMHKKIAIVSVLLAVCFGVGAFSSWHRIQRLQKKRHPKKRIKILTIMSYQSPWTWTDDQFTGFKDAMKGVNAEYKVFQMDTKRKYSANGWKTPAHCEQAWHKMRKVA